MLDGVVKECGKENGYPFIFMALTVALLYFLFFFGPETGFNFEIPIMLNEVNAVCQGKGTRPKS